MYARPAPGYTTRRAAVAVERALRFARSEGFEVTAGEIVSEESSVLVRLSPEPLLARMSHQIDILRADGSYLWFCREVAVTRHLLEAGFRAPRALTDPVLDDDVSISLWEWIDLDPHPHPPAAELGASLAVLHDALAPYDGPLPDIREVLEETAVLAGHLDRDHPELAMPTDAFRAELERILTALDRLDPGHNQALHGDAHRGNVAGVDGELMWFDFEDTCSGPVEYDLGAMFGSDRRAAEHDEPELLSGYGRDVDPELLELMIEARIFQVTVWCAVLLTEMPNTRQFHERVSWWLESYGS